MNRKIRLSGSIWILTLIAFLILPLAAQDGGGMPPETERENKAKPVNLSTALTDALDKAKIEEEAERERVDANLANCKLCLLPGGLDHIANGSGARNAGHGTIRLRGAPAGAVPVRAMLYWGVILNAASVPSSATVNFEGHPVTGTLVGTAGQPCWNGAGVFAAYRANVTQFVPDAIDGDYQVDGIPTSASGGQDPWAPANTALPLAQGTSLAVIYADRNIPNTSRIYLHEGPWLFTSNNLLLTHALSPALPGNSLLRHTRIGGDGQVGSSVLPSFPTTREDTSINGTQIQGPGSAGHDSDWNGSDGGPLNQLWDTRTTNAVGTIPVGATSYRVSYTNVFDCVNPVVHILSAR